MSRPHLAALSAAIEKLGGDEYIFDRVADGEPMRAIAETFGYSRGMIYTWIKAGGPEREAGFRAAREAAAHTLVEDSGEILDAAAKQVATPADVQLAKARSEHKKWLASMFNRKDYGDETGKIDVNLNIGQLHLDALRAHGRRQPALTGRDLSALPPGDGDDE